MNQKLKQRLVGSAVITSLAAIFVPMLFDDPIDETGKMIGELTIPDAPTKSLDADSVSLPKNSDEVINLPRPLALKGKPVKKQPVSRMVRWFLQVGIYAQKSNALLQQKKLRKQGFPAMITTESGKNGLLYRVKVGPELNRKRAEAMKAKIDKLNNIKSFLTSVDE